MVISTWRGVLLVFVCLLARTSPWSGGDGWPSEISGDFQEVRVIWAGVGRCVLVLWGQWSEEQIRGAQRWGEQGWGLQRAAGHHKALDLSIAVWWLATNLTMLHVSVDGAPPQACLLFLRSPSAMRWAPTSPRSAAFSIACWIKKNIEYFGCFDLEISLLVFNCL